MSAPPSKDIPSPSQQFSSPAEHSLDQALLSLPELSDGLPELLQGHSKVPLHSLLEPLPHLGYMSMTATAAALLAPKSPTAASGDPRADNTCKASSFSLTSETPNSSLYRGGPEHGRLKYHVQTSPGMYLKFFQRCELL